MMRNIGLNFESSTHHDLDNKSVYKFLVLGDSRVGKTSLFRLICKGKLPKARSEETLGCNVHIKLEKREPLGGKSNSNEENYNVYEFWEIGGQLEYYPFANVYTNHQLDEFKGIFYVFDASNIKTLYNLKKQLKAMFDRYFEVPEDKPYGNIFSSPKRFPILFVANKIDAVDKIPLEVKAQLIEKTLKDTFSEEPDFPTENVAYVSALVESEANLKPIMDFIGDVLNDNYRNMYMIDEKTDFESGGFLSLIKRKFAGVAEKIGEVRAFIAEKFRFGRGQSMSKRYEAREEDEEEEHL